MMSKLDAISSELPAHLAAVQLLVNRCPDPESKKHLIVSCGTSYAITGFEAHLLITANQLETA